MRLALSGFPRQRRAFVMAAGLLLFGISAAAGQDDARTGAGVDKQLEEQLFREQEARAGCKASICDIARSKSAQGEDVACRVVKTWPKFDLVTRVFRRAINWPWGHVQCEANVVIDRKVIVAAMSQPAYDAMLGKHDIVCRLSTEDGKDRRILNLTIDPVVTFEHGKATRAFVRWSKLNGTMPAKSVLWSAAAVDNAFNAVQRTVLERINDFLGRGCDEALKK
jgi:hypothetical protein